MNFTSLVGVLLCLLCVPVLRAQEPKAGPGKERPKKAAPEPKHPTDLKRVETKEIEGAIQRGIAILVADQESLEETKGPPGEWPYEGVYRYKKEIPIGYRIGGTSICALALIDASGGMPGPEAHEAIERGLKFVLGKLDDPLMSTEFEKGYDVRGWGHAYALSFLLGMREAKLVPRELGKAVDTRVKKLIGILEETQIGENGGWNYSRPVGDESEASTFMTAPTLQILFEARRQGEKVDQKTIERALKTLEDARLESGAFQYGTDPENKHGKGFEAVEGSTGRSPVCETTLFLAGRGSVERIESALDAFFEHWRWLEQRRRQNGTHVEPFMIAPYYFYYAHRYAAQAIEVLPEEKRVGYREKLYGLLWHVREESGGWNDRVFPRSENFGTAMTLMALGEPKARRPAGWSDAKPTTGPK